MGLLVLTLYDSTSYLDVPEGGDAYGAYINGLYRNFDAVVARFPGTPVLDITVWASGDATCLDIEPGDASPEQAPDWVARQVRRGVYRPVVYANKSTMPSVLAHLADAGIDQTQVRVWSAHYTGHPHICSPAACGASFTADGTQWATQGIGTQLHVDISLLNDDFFYVPALAPAVQVPEPKATVQEDDEEMKPIVFDAAGGQWVLFPSGAYFHIPAGTDTTALEQGGALGAGAISDEMHQELVKIDHALVQR